MVDKRLFDIEDIDKIKRTQSLLWVIFFVIIIVSVFLLTTQMKGASDASDELAKIAGVKFKNKLGEVVKEKKKPRFEAVEGQKTIDWKQYWEKKWRIHTIWSILIFFITVLLEIMIIVQIRHLQKLELEKTFKYELEKHQKEKG